jgi:hypothetical protein
VAIVHKPTAFEGLGEPERRAKVLALIQKTLAGARKTGQCTQEFVEAFRKPQAQFAKAGKGRWHLAPERGRAKVRTDWTSLGELFGTAQGVTPGGEGCLDLFLMEEDYAKAAGFEGELLHPVVKGLDIEPYHCRKTRKVILYPYVVANHRARPAFNLAAWKARQKADSMSSALRSLNDALDYHNLIDAQEEEYRGSGALDEAALHKLLSHREALGLVAYPNVAKFLTKYYKQLETRIFKKRNIRDFNREWYEFIWPRDIERMLKKPKLISPRLTKQVRFTLDRKGIVPQDSCIALVVTDKTAAAWQRFTGELSDAMGWAIDDLTGMKVAIGFANSDYAQKILVTGRQPTPKGSYQVTDDLLNEIQIPPLKSGKFVAELIEAVDILVGPNSKAYSAAQERVNTAVAQFVGSPRE